MAYISFQPSDFFNTVLYTGNGTTGHAITGVGFQPDMVWMKSRENTYSHTVATSILGVNKEIYPDNNGAEYSGSEMLTSFDSDGFTVGTDAGWNSSGAGTNTKVTWNWKAGTTTGLSGGTITPTSYSINTTSGFGIYNYTGTGSAGTIAHGLGVAPTMMIVKKYNTTGDWYVYHKDMPSGNGYHLRLNANSAQASGTEWNSTDPTSTVFSLGANSNVNASGATFIAYVFAPIKGYSKFGSYTGNGNADGTFVYTGFRPAWILIKRTNGTLNWMLYDSKRTGINQENAYLEPNTTAAEALTVDIDILSNGFKIRDTATSVNGTPDPYAYAACAEFPLVSSNSKPGVAR